MTKQVADSLRQRLHQLAYRMLGSVQDAEDVVQDAQLRLLAAEAEPGNTAAWMVRVVTNLCIDRLRAAKAERAGYVGPWLPEPLLAERFGPGPADKEPDVAAGLAEELSTAMLLMLERLSPSERAVFVLREGFGYSFDELAELLGVSSASARQRMSRARQHLASEPRYCAPPAVQTKTLLSLMQAITSGDPDAVIDLLASDAVAYTDGGGVVSAAIIPIETAARIATVAIHLVAKLIAQGEFEVELVNANAAPALLVRQGGQGHSLISIDCDNDGVAHRVYVHRNPNKLASLES